MKKYKRSFNNAIFKYELFDIPHGVLFWNKPHHDYWIMYKGNAMFTEYNLTLII